MDCKIDNIPFKVEVHSIDVTTSSTTYRTDYTDRYIKVILQDGSSKSITPLTSPKIFNYFDKNKILEYPKFANGYESEHIDYDSKKPRVNPLTNNTMKNRETNYNDEKMNNKIANAVDSGMKNSSKQPQQNIPDAGMYQGVSIPREMDDYNF